MNPTTILTIGHSDHTLQSFLALLEYHGVQSVLDVRSHPYSRRHRHFKRWTLERCLVRNHMNYVFLGRELGARCDDETVYRNGRVDFTLLSNTERFNQGLDRVEVESVRWRCCLLCAEADPLTCHRTILVARHLRERGYEIGHILKDGTYESATRADDRLVSECGYLALQTSLFGDTPDPIEAAYSDRGRQIAYRKPSLA